jgi:hypothetical protein
LGRLHGRRNLRVGGGEKAGNLFGQRLVCRESGELVLPEVEVAPCQSIDVTRVVAIRSHDELYHRCVKASFVCAKRSLSHCGIGAKVAQL